MAKEVKVTGRWVDKISDPAKKSFKSVEDSAKKSQKSILSSAGTMLSFGAAVAGTTLAIKASVDAHLQLSRANAKIEQTIRATGGAAGLTADQLSRMSVEMQRNTNFTELMTKDAQNLLLTFTEISGEVFPEALSIIHDVSEAMGGEGGLKGAAIQVGKALNDPIIGVGALAEVGVTFNEVQKETIKNLAKSGDVMGAQKLILAELKREFGGAAQAAHDAGGGGFEDLQKSATQLGAVFGEILLPTIRLFTDEIKEAADGWKAMLDSGNQQLPLMITQQIKSEAIQSKIEKTTARLGKLHDIAKSRNLTKREALEVEVLNEKNETLKEQMALIDRSIVNLGKLEKARKEAEKEDPKKAGSGKSLTDKEKKALEDKARAAETARANEKIALVDHYYEVEELDLAHKERLANQRFAENETARNAQQEQWDSELDAFWHFLDEREKAEQRRSKNSEKLRQDYNKMLQKTALDGIGILTAIAPKNKALAITEIGVSTAVAIMNAARTQPFVPAGVSAMGLAAATGARAAVDVSRAETGAEFTTNGPEWLYVGDNPGGVEEVTVKPVGTRNENGPKGGGQGVSISMPVTIQGNVDQSSLGVITNSLENTAQTIISAIKEGYLSLNIEGERVVA